MHNPIADMYGPYFLLFDAAVIAVLVAEAVWSRYRNDPTRGMEPPPIPDKIDPREVAYLRGGAKDLTRLVVFDLIRRGFLRLQDRKPAPSLNLTSKIERAPGAPVAKPHDPIESMVLEYFAVPRKAAELFRPHGLATSLEEPCEPIAEALRDKELISPPERYAAAWRVGLSGGFMILALGGYKLGVALANGRRNVAFLIILTAIGLGALAIAAYVPRLSWRGRQYLKRLQDAFAGLRHRTAEENECAVMTGTDPTILLVPALFGVAALSGTGFGYVADLFKTSTSGGGGCGGGSCGGGGCGGGGCGGGCGGCGG
jgi:uncharacterized protein (TIGR04222 family)